MNAHTLDLHGQRFGKLVATNILERHNRSTVRLCRCDCGQEAWLPTYWLTCGRVKSCGCLRSKQPGQAARNQVLDSYKRDARKRGLEWSLSDEEFDDFTSACCYYCHRKPNTIRVSRGNNGAFVYNGLDRKDNTKGYYRDNIVPCCKICNRAKRDMTFGEFQMWLHDVSQIRHGGPF